ncbi:sodium/hydrogen exchanger, putative [Entamoeba invadens IP1]|uniref:Sodium/hydrogen exchanger n=1 Tax=Entamoeba invadens IP1 TaxID=370355 RepID=A0A0A1U1L8_ENTIV|nr:sodium/hydrogen exchanger, putative [Entamoeba invadens IP1]ELP87907.1 sodium/hydrogen exchanger, putative [Entamoeba invadens IP1]|eukprot:XP_004254678.1 sodium/hydrogen exchanger, putative [Entamoeba invadens IP1]
MSTISSVSEETDTETFEVAALLVCSIFLFTLLTMIFVRIVPFLHIFSESIVSLFIGILVGLVLLGLHYGGVEYILDSDNFASIFQTLLLPLIIFNAGFTMKKRNFFKNIVPILSFAVGGCVLSSLLIGFGIYAYTFIDVDYIRVTNMNMSQSLQFGTLLGATDPVATLALFLELNVDPLLYSLVFGESVLNDAVSIVLFHTLDSSLDQFTFVDFLIIIGEFLLNVVGSLAIGLFVSYFSAFIFNKVKSMHISGTFNLLMILCVAFIGYFVSNLLGVSGILTIFVSGAIMSHHHWYSIPEDQRPVLYTSVGTLAFVSDTLTFISVGVTLFNPHNLKGEYWNPLFMPYVLFLCFFSRALNVFPISFLMNFRKKAAKITWRHQLMLWYAGLRGAIAIILALQMGNPLIVNTTYMIVLFTNVVIGMTTPFLLKLMKIKMGGAEPLNVRNITATESLELEESAPGKKKAFRKMFVMFDELVLKKYFGGQPRNEKDLVKIDPALGSSNELETDREKVDRKFRENQNVKETVDNIPEIRETVPLIPEEEKK